MAPEAGKAAVPQSRSFLERVRIYFKSEKALSSTAAVAGVLAIVPAIINSLGLADKFTGPFKEVGFPFLAGLAAVTVGYVIYTSKGD
jgi:hypothetical protein